MESLIPQNEIKNWWKLGAWFEGFEFGKLVMII